MSAFFKNTKKFFTSGLSDSGEGSNSNYRSYTALLNQSNAAAPVETILFDNITGITYEYSNDPGLYIMTIDEGYDLNKLAIFFQATYNIAGQTRTSVNYYPENPGGNEIFIYTYDADGIPANGILRNTPIEVRIYN